MIKKLLILTTLLISSSLFAADFAELKSAVLAARESLLVLLNDPTKRGADQQTLVKKTADDVSAFIAKLKAPAGKEDQFNEMKKNWDDFKKTRENDLVPAIIAGKQDEANKIATGVQKERLKKVLSNIDLMR